MLSAKEVQLLIESQHHPQQVHGKVCGIPVIAFPEEAPLSGTFTERDCVILNIFAKTPTGYIFDHSKIYRIGDLSEVEIFGPIPESELAYIQGDEGVVRACERKRGQ